MHRHYDTDLFARKIETIREKIPDAFIGVDLITGVRGETEELFEESRRFVESLDISQLHVFTYSERPGNASVENQSGRSRPRKTRALPSHARNLREEIARLLL